jgi:uncharacterized damage-inducible protein DinB
MLNQYTLLRLETQLEVIPLLLAGATPEAIQARPSSGQWSALENLAHLARHHEVFLERLHRILSESAPRLDRYIAEEDSTWPEWSHLTLEEVLSRLKALRGEIISFTKGLLDTEASRVGVHPLFGEMSIALWLEFFLLHEAHHLYVVMTRLGQAKKSLSARLSAE